jgi:cell division protein FtsB
MDRCVAQAPPTRELPRLTPRHVPNRWLPWALAFIACAVALNALIGDRSLAETLRARGEQQRLGTDLARIRQENAALQDRINRLSHDPRTIEELARQELGLARKGEVLVLIKNVDQK